MDMPGTNEGLGVAILLRIDAVRDALKPMRPVTGCSPADLAHESVACLAMACAVELTAAGIRPTVARVGALAALARRAIEAEVEAWIERGERDR